MGTVKVMLFSVPPPPFFKTVPTEVKKEVTICNWTQKMGARICYVDTKEGVCFAVLFISEVQLRIYRIFITRKGLPNNC